MDHNPTFPAERRVYHAEALAWLRAHPADPQSSIVTSLPDVSEVPKLGWEGWQVWFVEAAREVIRWVPDGGVSIFFQSDIYNKGRWVDKGHLIQNAAAAEGAFLLWHKIVCRKPPGTVVMGRASFSHMLCISRVAREGAMRRGPDVIADGGSMSWPRAMGETACRVACRFLREETPTRTVVDPFCGQGSVLAVANAMGFEAVGIDWSNKRCQAALLAASAAETRYTTPVHGSVDPSLVQLS